MKEHIHAGACRQEHQVHTGFFDELEVSAIGDVDCPKWDRTSAFSGSGGPSNEELTVGLVCL